MRWFCDVGGGNEGSGFAGSWSIAAGRTAVESESESAAAVAEEEEEECKAEAEEEEDSMFRALDNSIWNPKEAWERREEISESDLKTKLSVRIRQVNREKEEAKRLKQEQGGTEWSTRPKVQGSFDSHNKLDWERWHRPGWSWSGAKKELIAWQSQRALQLHSLWEKQYHYSNDEHESRADS